MTAGQGCLSDLSDDGHKSVISRHNVWRGEVPELMRLTVNMIRTPAGDVLVSRGVQ